MIEFAIGQAICLPRFMTLAQADQILDMGGDSPPSPGAVVDQKSPGQIGFVHQKYIFFKWFALRLHGSKQ